MPVDWSRYPRSWKRIRKAILRRAGNRCEWCPAVNGQPNPFTGSKVVLTIAHLGEPFATAADKHDKFDIRAENLAALCQRCHLRHDIDEHVASARKTSEAKRERLEPTLFPLP